MDIRVLGPVEVLDDQGEPIRLGIRQKQVLSLLVASLGETVRSDLLMDELWGADDENARKSLHTAISSLRAAIGRTTVVTASFGYRLAISPEAIDSFRFARVVATARSAEPSTALDAAGRADIEWRGPPFLDVADDLPSLAAEIVRLQGLRLESLEQRFRSLIDVGRPNEAVPDLERLTTIHRLHEPFWALLVEALADSGRPVDALRAFQRARQTLATEIGVSPSAELQMQERRILEASSASPQRPASVPEVSFVASSDGTRIAYSDFGDGMALLIVPTWAGDLISMASDPRGRAFLESLGGGRRSIWMGYRGVGASQRDVTDVSVNARVADVEAVLTATGVEECDVFAIGDGVPVALTVAAIDRRVRRLAAFMPQIGLPSWLSPDAMSLFVETMRTNGTFGRRTISDIALPDEPPSDKRLFNNTLQATISDELIADCLEEQLHLDVSPVLGQIAAPTLVIMRERSNGIDLRLGPALASTLPNGSFVTVSGSAGVPWLGPGDVAAAAVTFFDR